VNWLEELLNVIANVGFPMAVCAYLLVRIEARLAELGTAIHSLREALVAWTGHTGAGYPPS